MRIAIVGNGAVGLSLAYRLVDQPKAPEIVVYGPSDLAGAYAGSTAAPAMVNVLGEITSKIRESWAARHMLEVGQQAMRLWPDVVERLNRELEELDEPRVNLYRGTYMVSRPGAERERENLAAMRETLSEHGYAYEDLDLSRPLRHPVVRPQRFEDGIFVPDEMFLNAGKLVNGLQRVLERRPNVEFRAVDVDAVEPGSGGVRDADGGRDAFDAVVLANSFGFNELVDGLELEGIPMIIPVYGVGSTLPIPVDDPFTVRTPVYGASCGDYAVHYPGHLYVGASAITNTDRVEIGTQLQRSLDFYDPDANLNGVHLTGGIRAMSQDVYPVIGPLAPGVWAAAGLYKSGITLAPYTAEVIARELLGEPPLLENRFPPRRRIDEPPPPIAELADTIWNEIAASQSSSGSRAAVSRYSWVIRLLVRWQASQTVRRLDKDVYYNSDIVQACIYDPAMIDQLNRHRPPKAA